ncbi:Global cell cycle regulator GcrA [Bartonella apihabitans]|uniref:Global cell cycle regulator GcrA n=2 Tax=Bartonellaceae TaxID=772 RepID=A0A1U9M8D7_9HYPH|nr:Global cell cycle regulator GcrA [Bartonella apihabitans]AQT43990.1 Global cell cycle regulator GcrA [Bartonella apihabitans]
MVMPPESEGALIEIKKRSAGMNWTDERVELLKKLWSDGLSASQIAAQLGGVSRNAVIGKVHRLKLSGRGKTTKATPRTKKPVETVVNNGTQAPRAPRNTPVAPVAAAVAASAKKPQPSTIGATALKLDFVADAVSEVEEQPSTDVVVPMSRHLSLLQLSENTCKWPVGDPLSDDFYFCGADAGESGPYCAFHAKLAFQPVSERRRVRA